MRSHGTLCCGARLLRRCAHRQKQSVRDGADYRTLPRRKPGSIFRQHELRIGGSRPAPGQPFHPGRVGRAGPCATCEDDSVIASPRVRALRGPRTGSSRCSFWPWIPAFAGIILLQAMVFFTVPAAGEEPKYGGTLTYMIPADAPPSFDAHREETYATIHSAAPFYSMLVRPMTARPTPSQSPMA